MVLPRLKEVREKKGITQAQMAKLLNCSQQAYSDYETGKHGLPIDILTALVHLYDVSSDYLLGVTDNPRINR